jgi:ankyrin repeat protein
MGLMSMPRVFMGLHFKRLVFRGHEIIVRYLVKHGADVNAQGGEYGNALSAAQDNDNVSIVRFLLEKNACRNSKDGGEYLIILPI